jgi:hypothetical protein
MPTERSQILTLLAAHRIDVDEAERLLTAARTRGRFFALVPWTFATITVASIAPLHSHPGENLAVAINSMLQSITGSAAFHHLLVFCYRLLGELP